MTSKARLWRIVLIFFGYLGTMFGVLLAAFLIGLLIAIASSAASFAAGWDAKTFMSSPWFVVEIILMVAAFLLANYVLTQYFMTYRIARHIVSTMTITNIAVVESVSQSKEARPRYGEGLADAFDIGAV